MTTPSAIVSLRVARGGDHIGSGMTPTKPEIAVEFRMARALVCRATLITTIDHHRVENPNFVNSVLLSGVAMLEPMTASSWMVGVR